MGFGWQINTGNFGVAGHSYVWEGGTTTGGYQEPDDQEPVDECWRSFSVSLWFPVDITWAGSERVVDEEGTTIGVRWKATIKSQCEDLCGEIIKKCLCPYKGDGGWQYFHTNPREGEVGFKKCRKWRVVKFEKMHDLCPPQKPCEPDWEIDPFPRGCPAGTPISFDLWAETAWNGDINKPPAPPDEGQVGNTIWNQMRTLTDTLISILDNSGYNMLCDGGRPYVEPPTG